MIPLSTPNIFGKEKEYIEKCLETGWISTSGSFIEDFEKNLSSYVGSKFAIACINGTSALQVSLKLLGVNSGDEVIAPTLTFIASINSIMYNNAYPVFMDCDQFYNLDIKKTVKFIKDETYFKSGFTYNKKTDRKIPVIMPVHVWGNAVWLDELVPLCNERNIKILEDASESLGTKYLEGNYINKHAGTVGEIGCISFNANKIITSGGGAMIITDNQEIAEKALYLTTQAKDDAKRYIHNDVGYNFRLTNIHAALGIAQLENIESVLTNKQKAHMTYVDKINKIDGLSISPTPSYSFNNCWLNILRVDKSKIEITIDQIMEKLEMKNIQTRPVWGLNHLQKPFVNYQRYMVENAQILADSSLCIPSSSHLTIQNIEDVTAALQDLL